MPFVCLVKQGKKWKVCKLETTKPPSFQVLGGEPIVVWKFLSWMQHNYKFNIIPQKWPIIPHFQGVGLIWVLSYWDTQKQIFRSGLEQMLIQIYSLHLILRQLYLVCNLTESSLSSAKTYLSLRQIHTSFPLKGQNQASSCHILPTSREPGRTLEKCFYRFIFCIWNLGSCSLYAI